MPGETVDASIVFLPRFTTLVGASVTTFTTLPLDVSQYSGAQFQVWRSSMSAGTFVLYLEESLDADSWVLGASTPTAFDFTNESTRYFSYSFRLRWFRLRVVATGIVTCWAEGLLRGGGAGAWPSANPASGAFAGVGLPAGVVGGPVTPPAPGQQSLMRIEDLTGDPINGAGRVASLSETIAAAIAKAKSG